MTPQELAAALRELDTLDRKRETFQAWLTGDTTHQQRYDVLKARIEAAFPGFSVVQVDLTFRHGHVLAPDIE